MAMTELLANISAQSEEMNVILLIGIAIFGGTVGARIFHTLRIPRIVGYVAIGIILGPLLKIISQQTIRDLEPFNVFALGIIGFLIGGELKREIFVKFGRQVVAILLFEGLAAFMLVGALSFAITWYFSDWKTGLAVGVVFGAICAATDPASTMSVLWEYKTRGPLTAMLTAIVALDDALALVLYAICVSVAGVVVGHGEVGFVGALLSSFYEIFGSIIIGIVAGIVLNWILKRTDEPERILIFCISLALLIIGVAITRELDVIIATMALGITLTNIGSRKVISSFELVRRFSAPIYVLFFVLVGARLNVSIVSTQVGLLAAAYIAGSIIGKTTGAWWGAVYSRTVPTIRKYLGFCLYQQGTIAIALLLMASSRFEGQVRDLMLSVIISGVFVLQLIGPVFVKIGCKKAGEVGLNITEEDLVRTRTIADIMDRKVPAISSGLSLSEVIKIVSSTDSFYYPVVDNEKKLIGGITLDGIRSTFATQEINDWLVAMDIAEPIITKMNPHMALAEAFSRTRRLGLEYVPVVDGKRADEFVGVLDANAAHRRLSAEVLAKQQEADSMYRAGTGKY
ncbi:MAG: cation:proton antiporter domain-containing protein [Planctomycetota bacterium]|jgi:Kef-type K+ transport system membrane component KefB